MYSSKTNLSKGIIEEQAIDLQFRRGDKVSYSEFIKKPEYASEYNRFITKVNGLRLITTYVMYADNLAHVSSLKVKYH